MENVRRMRVSELCVLYVIYVEEGDDDDVDRK